MPYTPERGGLLTLIHNKYVFPGNITKIPTPANILLYFQIIRIHNQPLQSWLITHMYMLTHLEDIQLLSTIKTTITNQITTHLDHTHTSCMGISTETLHLLEDKMTTSTHHLKKKIYNGGPLPHP
jgi:hypothetical protein